MAKHRPRPEAVLAAFKAGVALAKNTRNREFFPIAAEADLYSGSERDSFLAGYLSRLTQWKQETQ